MPIAEMDLVGMLSGLAGEAVALVVVGAVMPLLDWPSEERSLKR